MKTLLTWEAGSNLGHEMQVTSAAVLLKKEGHDVVVYAPHGIAANDAAQLAGIRWEQLPEALAVPLPLGQPLWHSRATALWGIGFHSVDLIRDRLEAWDVVYQREQPDVVALQAAPFAQVAAHVSDLRSVEFGIGFDVPPSQAPFPPFQGKQHFDPVQALRLEEASLDNIRRVIGAAAPRGATLQSLVRGHARLVITIKELDHYAEYEDASRQIIGPLPLVDIHPQRLQWTKGKPRVLAYLRADLLDAPQMLKALAALRGETVAVCIGADDRTVQLARKLKVRLHIAPVSISDLLPAADLVVSHGGGGMVAAAAVHGCRCVVLPTNYEQFLTGAMLAKLGIGVLLKPGEPAGYESALRRIVVDTGQQQAALAIALRYRNLVDKAKERFAEAVSAC